MNNIEKAANTWNNMDINLTRTVAWSSIKYIQIKIRNRFSGEKNYAEYVRNVLLDKRNLNNAEELNGVAIACGDMVSEKSFFEKDKKISFSKVDGFDISESSLSREQCEFNFIPHLVDCNYLILNDKYDLAIGSHGIHHIYNLDNIFSQLNKSLNDNGLLYMYEWIGPNYLQIPTINKIISSILLILFFNKKTRTTHMDKTKGLFYIQDKPELFDPSEACNSENLYPNYRKYFAPIKEVKFGALAYPIFEGISQNINQDSVSNKSKIKTIYFIESILTKIKIIKPLFLITVAQKK